MLPYLDFGTSITERIVTNFPDSKLEIYKRRRRGTYGDECKLEAIEGTLICIA